MVYELIYQDADCCKKRSYFFSLKNVKNFIEIYKHTMTQWWLYKEGTFISHNVNKDLYNNA